MAFKYRSNGKHVCGECVHFVICSKFNIKNAEKTTDYCLWEKDFYEKRQK